MLTDDDFDRLCRRLYRSLRDGSVDREATFDLSAEVLAYRSSDEKAAQAAGLAVADDADPAPLAAAAGELLASLPFEPGFGGHAVARVGQWPSRPVPGPRRFQH